MAFDLRKIINKLNNRFMGVLVYLVSVQIFILLIFFALRIVFLFSSKDIVEQGQGDSYFFFAIKTLTKGLRFDNVVTSHILLVPSIILPVLGLFNCFNKTILKAANIYFIIACFFVFAISVSDIPYFLYFNKHISFSVLNWIAYSKETAGMIMGDYSLFLYFLLFILVQIVFIVGIILIARFVLKYFDKPIAYNRENFKYALPFLLFFYVSCFFGMRGLFHQRIALVDATLERQPILSQIVVNPVFFLFTSSSPYTKSLMPEDLALNIVSQNLGFDITDNEYYVRLDKKANNNPEKTPNIVFIFVESFSSNYLDVTDRDISVLPNLTKLIDKSYYFDNFYSQGTHTNQGVVSSLYAFPAIFDKVMTLKAPVFLDMFRIEEYEALRQQVPIMHGLSNDLKNRGYKNMSFVAHTITYDNQDFFLLSNGFDECFGSENYPKEKLKSTWGVSDDYLFDYSISRIDSVVGTEAPFLVSILTISNHPPYIYPDEFKEVSTEEDVRAMAYADWCIGRFMEQASKCDWYNNTIFVIFGDHGKVMDKKHILPLSLVHVPLIIYSPLFEYDARIISNLAGQIDLYPTVMGLIGYEAVYNTFGIDLFRDERKYIFFTSDDKLGCLDLDYYYVYDLSFEEEYLYNLADNPTLNIIKANSQVADSMRLYSSAMTEGAKYIFRNYLK